MKNKTSRPAMDDCTADFTHVPKARRTSGMKSGIYETNYGNACEYEKGKEYAYDLDALKKINTNLVNFKKFVGRYKSKRFYLKHEALYTCKCFKTLTDMKMFLKNNAGWVKAQIIERW